MKKILAKIASLSGRHPLAVWLGSLLVTLALLPGAYKLSVSGDYAQLLPKDSESLKNLHELSRKVDGLGEFIVLLEGAPIQDLIAFAEEMSRDLRGEPLLRRVRYRSQTDYFEKRKFLYLSLDDLKEFSDAVQDKIREEHLQQSPMFVDLDEETEADKRLDDFKKKHEVDDYFSYFADGKREKLLLLLSPRAFPDDGDAAKHLEEIADRAAAKARAALPGTPIQVSYGGPYMELLYDNQTLLRDMKLAGIVTTVLMFLTLFPTYRSFWTPLAFFLPLAPTMAWTFCLAGFFYPGGLNPMSGFLGMILFGLGIDFGIHLYHRYGEERNKGHSIDDALRIATVETGESCVFAAATTGASFAVLAVARFRGYTQYGILAAMGIVVALIGILFLMPALLAWSDRRGRSHWILSEHRGSAFYRTLSSFTVRRPGLVGTLVFVATALSLWAAPRLGVDFSVSHYRPHSEEIERVNAAAKEILEIASVPAVYAVTGLDQVDDLVSTLHQKDERSGDPIILKVRSARDLLPDREAEKRAVLADLDAALLKERALADDDEDRERIDDFRADIAAPPVRIEDVPPELMGEFHFGKNDYLVYLFPDPALGKAESFSLSFSERFGKVDGRLATYRGSGPVFVEADILSHLLKEGPSVMFLSAILVAVLAILLMRTLFHSLLVLFTLAIGLLWTAGVTVALGEQINVYNVVTLPTILGMSVDYAIHIVHRFQHRRGESIEQVLENTGAALWMAHITTLVGFGGLVISRHQGLRSLGLLANVGLVAAMVSIYFFMPLAVTVWLRVRKAEAGEAAAVD
ncbi:MAG: MMPL family transporter [Bdellovibrionota bacterium]